MTGVLPTTDLSKCMYMTSHWLCHALNYDIKRQNTCSAKCKGKNEKKVSLSKNHKHQCDHAIFHLHVLIANLKERTINLFKSSNNLLHTVDLKLYCIEMFKKKKKHTTRLFSCLVTKRFNNHKIDVRGLKAIPDYRCLIATREIATKHCKEHVNR